MRLAADTNVLLDLADEVEHILDALAVIDERLPDAERLAPPSVLDELAYLADSGQTPQVRRSARRAIQQLRNHPRFRPVLELPFSPGKADILADEFRRARLLPSDEHLRSIDHQQLTWLLNQHDLSAPVIATPREIVRKFFR